MVRAQDWYAVEVPAQVERSPTNWGLAIERIRARPLLFAALRQETRRAHLNASRTRCGTSCMRNGSWSRWWRWSMTANILRLLAAGLT